MSEISQLVNVSRDELAEVVGRVLAIRQVDQRVLSRKFAALLGDTTGQGPGDISLSGIDPEIVEKLNSKIAESMVDNLIINDREVPLVNVDVKSLVSDILHSAGTSNDEDEEFNRLLAPLITDLVESMAKELNSIGQIEIREAYDRAWREIDAYRSLEAEHSGLLDLEDQAIRDEFIRRSTTPEEWLDKVGKRVADMYEKLPTLVRDMASKLVDGLVAMLTAGNADSLTPEEIAELKADILESFDDSQMTAQLAQAQGLFQAYFDQRYIEIWVEPNM